MNTCAGLLPIQALSGHAYSAALSPAEDRSVGEHMLRLAASTITLWSCLPGSVVTWKQV